VVSVTRRLPWR